MGHLVIQTTKPIQSQFKANLSQLKPILTQFGEKEKIDAKFSYTTAYEENTAMDQKQSQFKPNSKPIFRKEI